LFLFFICIPLVSILIIQKSFLGRFKPVAYTRALINSPMLRKVEYLNFVDFLYNWNQNQVSYLGRESVEIPVRLKLNREDLKIKWKARINSFLNRGVLPIVDLSNSINNFEYMDFELPKILNSMDKYGIAILAFDSKPPTSNKHTKNDYVWQYYSHSLVNRYPDRFILSTNRGNNKNWVSKDYHYIKTLFNELKTGDYSTFGELPFLHYLTPTQCLQEKYDEFEFNIEMDGEMADAVFNLARLANMPLYIHVETELEAIEKMTKMLKKYPDVKVIQGHFPRILQPLKSHFLYSDYRRILRENPNLYYDLHINEPNRRHPCFTETWKSHIWEEINGKQVDHIDPELFSIMNEFSDRFISGFVYRFRSGDFDSVLLSKSTVMNTILSNFSPKIQHQIAYQNAWFLLTGEKWIDNSSHLKITARKNLKMEE
jgi:hypothetical protein